MPSGPTARLLLSFLKHFWISSGVIGLLSGLGSPLYGWICCASLSTYYLFLKNSVVSFIILLGSVTNLPSLLWILMFSYGLRCINFAALNIFAASLV